MPLDLCRVFGHWSPSRHVDVDDSTRRVRNVSGVKALGSGAAADPLTDAVTRALVVPLRELYAVLWRWGLLDIDD
ncbi:Rv1535 domain-containing protein [Mycolicibacterium confluentis]|uniref:Rv1535 domain-containing protein n=1 Tax=Mycolicibacterium confluentis TaxID=28047 RepID=UPI001F3BECD5|nr:Rv1535 domain-containing protein [Mycolicibacterium confluentis]